MRATVLQGGSPAFTALTLAPGRLGATGFRFLLVAINRISGYRISVVAFESDEYTLGQPLAMTASRRHALARAEPLLLIAVGGFVGAALRYAVALALPTGFPWGTLAVNVAGSFALGVLLYEAHLADLLSPETRLVVGTGFLSSFTTYSTFAVETVAMDPALAGVNVLANYVLGFAAVLAGRAVARGMLP